LNIRKVYWVIRALVESAGRDARFLIFAIKGRSQDKPRPWMAAFGFANRTHARDSKTLIGAAIRDDRKN
jgi:hypothetical protein